MSVENTDTSDAPQRRLRLIAGGGAIGTIVIVALYFLFFRPDYSVLYSDMRPEDAAVAVEALEKENIPYRLAAGGSEILVRTEQIDAARLELAGSGASLGASEGFELFNESDMGLTDFAQKIRYQRALQGELARTIMAMEGVADARVHITMPERTLFRSERRSARAAVTLTMLSPEEETQQRIEGVQRLVAASVPDLSVADVVVLNARGEVLSPTVNVATTTVSAQSSPPIDAILAVVREALPAHRFEVSLDPVTPDLVGAESEIAAVPAMVVTVTTAERLSDVEMERVSMALRASGVIDGDTSASLQFRIAPPNYSSAQANVTGVSRPQEVAPAREFDIQPFLPWLGIGALALLSAFLVAITIWLNRPKLAPEEQEKFAARLRTLLDAELVGGERG